MPKLVDIKTAKGQDALSISLENDGEIRIAK